MRRLIARGLEDRTSLWPDVERAYAWVHRAAHVLNNRDAEDAGVVGHFRKIFRGYRPGLSHAYDVPGLRRTNSTRFRRDLHAHLAALERQACQSTLPA